ncbi:hypothetical protein QJS04_geneDACA000665 [Acorus gramineus]|uniref:Programmed cell death protein 2 C-terminal domain-containing protein n=1 Tax=Acorus gramineus TaxID=55184 RepID=A0AAV9ATI1_ACOGR|nr:hypothetical protein QJS04_geneDACA000665 [Acorus gramineus]
MGEVILGLPGPWAADNREPSDHYTSKIGGLPDWPVPRDEIKTDLLKCSLCGRDLCLVAQVYAPISCNGMNIDERVIYILGCTMQNCGSNPRSWRTLRVQKSFSGTETSQNGHGSALSDDLSVSVSNNHSEESCWTGQNNEENWGNDEDMDLLDLGRALSEASSVAAQPKKKNSCIHIEASGKDVQVKPKLIYSNLPVVPCFYIYYQEERSSSVVNSICDNYSSLSIKENLYNDYEEDETWSKENYEYDRALYADRTYLKFKKRVEACPEQCLRYSYSGKPLLSTNNLQRPGTCGRCGGSRKFEMQLMPPLLYFLQQAADGSTTCSPKDWNWLTLIVYTCSKNCNSPFEKSSSKGWTIAEEKIILQSE